MGSIVSWRVRRNNAWKTYVFATDLPALFLLVEALRELVAVWSEADDDVTLDGAHTADLRCAGGRGHGPDRDLKLGRGWGGTVVRQLVTHHKRHITKRVPVRGRLPCGGSDHP